METSQNSIGRFVWHDLMTSDVKASVKFYRDLLGWNIVEQDSKSLGKYNMIRVAGKDIGGFIPLDSRVRSTSQWLPYVTTDDLDRTLDRVKKMGGQVTLKPKEVTGVGRTAMIIDPQGAATMLLKSDRIIEAGQVTPKVGEFFWNELATTDPEGARGFYGELFNWSFEERRRNEPGSYFVVRTEGQDIAGIQNLSPHVDTPPHWLPYLNVTDVDGMVKKVQRLGGKTLVEPTDLKDMGRYSVVQDQVGAIFGFFHRERL